MLTKQDLHNLLQLLNRVTTTGIDEASVVVVLSGKLKTMLAEESREDVPAAAE